MARELTGRHVLIITLAAFGVIIAVNVLMAVLAVGSFPGLEVQNSYVASQAFDRDRLAQQNLGWEARANYDGKEISIEIVDQQGGHPILRDFTATIGRPTHKRADVTPQFVASGGGVYQASVALESGIWNIHVQATASNGTIFRQRLDHYAGSTVN